MFKALISGSFIVEPIRDTLEFWLQQTFSKSEIHFSPYNQVFHTLLNMKGEYDLVFILIRAQDLFSSSDQENIDLFIQHLQSASANQSSQICVVFCPDQIRSQYGNYLNSKIDLMANVHYIELQTWLDIYAVKDVHDALANNIAHIPYKPLVYTVLGTVIMRVIYAAQSQIIKLICVDCDNTLWKGVVAEENVIIYSAFQKWLFQQRQRGISLAVFSKNVPEDVEAVFENHPDSVLKKGDVVAWCVNWENKAFNLKKLVDQLNIGLDSVIFIDDNPVECATVSSLLPEVVVVQFDLSHYQHIWDIPIFCKNSSVDTQRTTFYQQHLKREGLRTASGTFKEFINSLKLNVHIDSIEANDIERVAQLTQRTNQFNASTIRRNSAQVQEFLKRSGHSVYVVHADDRFGEYGLIGTIFLKGGNDGLVVDTFLLSCRVLGRGIEHQMASFIGTRAEGRTVHIAYQETERNKPVQKFFESIPSKNRESEGYVFDSKLLASIQFDPDQLIPVDPLVANITVPRHDEADRSYFAKLTTSLNTAELIRAQTRQKCVSVHSEETDFLESIIINCMSEVLNIEGIGKQDNLFFLGGDSFDVAILASHLQERTNKAIDVAHIYNNPTAESLALIYHELPALEKPMEKRAPGERQGTPEQHAIWYGMRGAADPSIYEIHLSYLIEGNLDLRKFEKCLDQLTKRHEALQIDFEVRANQLNITKGKRYFYSIAQCEPRRWKCDLMFHHLICDQHSIALFMRELSALYRGDELEALPLGSTFESYASTNHTVAEHTLEFWKHEGLKASGGMNPDRKARYLRTSIPQSLRRAILDFSRKNDVTPFVFLFSAFSVCIKFFLQEDEFQIGVPFSTRISDKIFGLFVNLLPVKIKSNNHDEFISFMNSCKRKIAQIFPHRFLPFYRIQESLDSSVNLKIVFAWTRILDQTPQLIDAIVTRLTVDPEYTEFDVRCMIEEERDQLIINIQYAISTYEEWQIRTLLDNFIYSLEKIVGSSSPSITNLIQNYGEVGCSSIPTECPNIIELFESVDPEHVALENESMSMSYREFNEKVNQLSHYYMAQGMGSGRGAVVCLLDSIEQVIASMAILKSGGYLIPLNCTDPKEYRINIIDKVKPFLIIEELPTEGLTSFPKSNPVVKISPNDLAYIMFTSGSTGTPKGVMIEHEGIGSRMLECGKLVEINPGSRVLGHTKPSFDMHICEWAVALCNGAVFCPTRRAINDIWNAIDQLRITHVYLTPGVLGLMPEKKPSCLQYLLVGGEATPKSLMEKWAKLATFVNVYGPCECSMITHMHFFKQGDSPRLIGPSLPGVECVVRDRHGDIVCEGGIGELYIGGIGVTRGYLGDDALVSKYYQTGDLVRLLPNALYEFVNRKHEYVKVNGCRVDLHLIADKTLEIQGVEDVAITAAKQADDKYVLQCHYTGALEDSRAIQRKLRKILPSYMVPSNYFHLEEIPRLENGKLDRKKLKTIEKLEQLGSDGVFRETEYKLSLIWSKLLNREARNAQFDFFQMGGDSLQAIKLLLEIEKEWGIEILMSDLYEHSSLSELAQLVDTRGESHRKQAVITIQASGSTKPLFLVHPSVGLADCYRSLAQYLINQPLYGIQNPFVIDPERRFSSLAEMAEYYTKELVNAFHYESYVLGGWSFGGVVALEVAKRLEEWGKSVDRVILLDSFAPGSVLLEAPLEINSTDLQKEASHNTELLHHHLAVPFDGKVCLIRACDSSHARNGWNSLGDLEVQNINVEHHRMFDSHNIALVAKAMKKAME